MLYNVFGYQTNDLTTVRWGKCMKGKVFDVQSGKGLSYEFSYGKFAHGERPFFGCKRLTGKRAVNPLNWNISRLYWFVCKKEWQKLLVLRVRLFFLHKSDFVRVRIEFDETQIGGHGLRFVRGWKEYTKGQLGERFGGQAIVFWRALYYIWRALRFAFHLTNRLTIVFCEKFETKFFLIRFDWNVSGPPNRRSWWRFVGERKIYKSTFLGQVCFSPNYRLTIVFCERLETKFFPSFEYK